MHNDSKLQNFNLFESREQFELNQSQLNENDISFIPYDQEEVTTEGVTNSVMEKLASTGDNNQVLAIGNQSEKVKARSLVTFALVVDTEIDLTTCKNNSENYTIIYDVLNNITYQKIIHYGKILVILKVIFQITQYFLIKLLKNYFIMKMKHASVYPEINKCKN